MPRTAVPAAAAAAATAVAVRAFSASHSARAPKIDVALIAKLRKDTQCTISKAKEALLAVTQPGMAAADVHAAAVEWLLKDIAESGAKKAAKVSDRVTAEGLVAVFADPAAAAAAMVEINSETDFVAKSDLFSDLAARVCRAVAEAPADRARPPAPLAVVEPEEILESPFAWPAGDAATVRAAFTETIGKLGENIRLRRAIVARADAPAVLGVYAHAGGESRPAGLGRFGCVVVLAADAPLSPDHRPAVAAMARKVAQHATGFAPKAIHPRLAASAEDPLAVAPEEALLHQDFLFGGGSVADALAAFSAQIGVNVAVTDFVRFACGEGIEKKKENFAEEVMKQAGM
ncbi:Elongation factor Ts, mitochondrial [Polyrhizophydium stewartii]|uniref:Elongation factor Ts, mitochondrial n=1 Tax=Polyrhizophydium stewartii TaxID=2732419 RepID=A0ABR4MYD8_9FUNG|nr:Elongation factor Ts, mitochondrial [Polyrhizophydium stewartii]